VIRFISCSDEQGRAEIFDAAKLSKCGIDGARAKIASRAECISIIRDR
jgi:hypothetical protein